VRGSKPDRSKIHQLAGPIGKHKARELREPGKPLMDLRPPKRLRGRALEVWKRLAPQLLEDQSLTELSVDHFIAYCDAVADYDFARRALERRQKRVAKTPNGGEQQITEVGMAHRALEAMLRLGEIFAIDPYSRQRRGLLVPPEEISDAGDDLLTRRAE
jgi:P27 family predicted phage terminase small subunit